MTLEYCPGCTYHAENGCTQNKLQAATAEMQTEHAALRGELQALRNAALKVCKSASTTTLTLAPAVMIPVELMDDLLQAVKESRP